MYRKTGEKCTRVFLHIKKFQNCCLTGKKVLSENDSLGIRKYCKYSQEDNTCIGKTLLDVQDLRSVIRKCIYNQSVVTSSLAQHDVRLNENSDLSLTI